MAMQDVLLRLQFISRVETLLHAVIKQCNAGNSATETEKKTQREYPVEASLQTAEEDSC